MKKGWIILIFVVIAVLGVAFLYFYSPTEDNGTIQPPTNFPTSSNFQLFQTNETPIMYNDVYTGVLNGTLSGFLFEGIVSEQYMGTFNGSYNGYGWINNQLVFFSTKISIGRMSGTIAGQHKGVEFRGNILANVENVQMNGTITYINVEKKEPITFWTLFKKIWWALILLPLVVIIIWAIVRFSGDEEVEKHTITEIDLSIRPLLEGEPYDREIRRFIRNKPVPNAIKPKYHQILYECAFPNGEYILVDAKYDRILKVHTNVSAPDVKKNMDEIQISGGMEGGGQYPSGGYRGGGGYRRPGYSGGSSNYRKGSTRRSPQEGEFGGGDEEV